MLSLTGELYTESLSFKVEELKRALPESEQIHNPEMLTCKKLQAVLFQNPSRDSLNPKVQELSDDLQNIRRAQSDGYVVPKPLKEVFKQATVVRALAKTVIITDWVMDHVLHASKTGAEAIKAQGEMMNNIVERANVRLPTYLTDLINAMAQASA